MAGKERSKHAIAGLGKPARNQGKRLGRPPLRELSREEAHQIRAERREGKASYRALAKKYRITLWSAHTLCANQ